MLQRFLGRARLARRERARFHARKAAVGSAVRPITEALECRRLLTAIAWDGGPTGNGTSFTDPTNWAGDVLPGALDTASIGATGTSPNITITGAVGVSAITTSRILQLNGGTVTGGSVSFTGSGAFNAGNGGTLANVTVNGDLNFVSDNAHLAVSGTTSFVTAHLANNFTSIGFAPGYTLNGTVQFEGAGTSRRDVESTSAGTVTIGATGAIKTAAGFAGSANIGASDWFGGAMTLVNNGLISSEVSGTNLSVVPASLTSTGTLKALNGGILNIQPGGTYANGGNITVNASTLNLGSTFDTTGGIGTWSNTAGTVNLTGTMTNGATTLNTATGSWNLKGGTINGGSLSFAGGAALNLTASGGTLANVTVNGDLNFNVDNAHVGISGTTSFNIAHLANNFTSIGFAPGYTLNGTVQFEGAGGSRRDVESASAGTFTIGATGVIKTVAGFAGSSNIGGSDWFGGAMTLVNNGTISAEANGANLSVVPSSFTTTGALKALTGGILNLQPGGNYANGGTITLNAATLNLAGTFNTTAGIGTWSNTASTVNFTGTMTNGATTLDASTGSWNLKGGTINGGSLSFAGGAALNLTATGGTLANVTVNGDLNFNVDNAHIAVSGTTSFVTAHLSNNFTSIGFAPGYTLNGTVQFEGAGTSRRDVESSSAGMLTIGATGVIKTVAGFAGSSNIGGSDWFGGAMTLVNNGTISAEVNGTAINITPASLTNNGTLKALNGGILTLAPGGSYTNPGNITVNASTINLAGTFDTTAGVGTWSNTGGTVNLTGTMTNGATTLNTATGSWNLKGGTINGGSLSFAGGAALNLTSTGGALANVTVNGDLNFNVDNAHIAVSGTTSFVTAHLSNNFTSIGFAPGYTLNGAVQFEGAGTSRRDVESTAAGSLTIGATGVIKTVAGFAGSSNIGGSDWFGGAMTLVNNGLISSEVNGTAINITPASLTNNGTLKALNGGILTLAPGGSYTNPGNITVNASTINLAGTFDTTAGVGTWSNTAGTVNLIGTMTNGATTLNTATGSWNLKAGTINGGSLSFANGQNLNLTSTGGILNNVTVNGDLNFNVDNAHVAILGTTSFAVAHLINNFTSIGFAPGYTLNGAVQFEGAGTSRRDVESTAAGSLTIGATGVIKTVAGFAGTAYLGGSDWYGGAMALINNGTISDEVLNAILNIPPSSFANNGTLKALNGAVVNLQPATSYTNAGAITLNASTLNLGGTFDTTGGIGTWSNTASTVNLVGIITNGATTLNTATGTWNLKAGTINGGSLSFANGQTLALTTSGGTLNNVTVNGDLSFNVDNAHAVMAGTTSFAVAHLINNFTSIGFAPGYTLNGTVQFEGAGASRRDVESAGAGTVTIGATGAIKAASGFAGSANIGGSEWYGGAMTLVNNGLISSESPLKAINIQGTAFTNNGLLKTLNGGVIATNFITVGNVDLSNGYLVVRASAATRAAAFAALYAQIAAAEHNVSPNTWLGTGVESVLANTQLNAGNAVGVGIKLNDNGLGSPVQGAFGGQGVGINDILIRYTYFGDDNLDGKVDADDVSGYINGFNNFSNAGTWDKGDFNYDGHINADDTSLLIAGVNSFGAHGALAAPVFSDAAIAAGPSDAGSSGASADSAAPTAQMAQPSSSIAGADKKDDDYSVLD